MWYVAALWPATDAIIGVYDHPPAPAQGDVIGSYRLDAATVDAWYWQRQAVELAQLLTRAKDFLHSIGPG